MKNKQKSQKRDRQQTNLVVIGIVLIAVLAVIVLIRVNNPSAFGPPPQIGPDPSITRGVSPSGFHTLGSPDAPITIVVYEDFGCPNCKHFFDTVEPDLIDLYIATGEVLLEIHTIAIVNRNSLPGAEAVFCAEEQGYFWEFRQVAFLNQGVRAFDRDNFAAFAEAIGMEVDAFLKCYDAGTYRKQIIQQSQAAQQFGIQGTPTFEVAGERYPKPGSNELPDILQVVADLLLEEQ